MTHNSGLVGWVGHVTSVTGFLPCGGMGGHVTLSFSAPSFSSSLSSTTMVCICILFVLLPPSPLCPQSQGRPARLNVAREALLKAQGPISLVQMHEPHQTFMQIAMFYLNNYEVIHRKRLLSFSLSFFARFLPPNPPRAGAAASSAATNFKKTSPAAIFALVPMLSHFIECDRNVRSVLFHPERCCLQHMSYMCTCDLPGLLMHQTVQHAD